METIEVKEVLNKLEQLGWTEIIDSRWKQKLLGDIYDNFPDIDPKTVEYILKLVLV